MHTYTLTITKDDFWLEFKSADKHIVEKELGVWITAAAELWEETKDQTPSEPQILEPKFEKVELGRILLDRPKVSTPEPEPITEYVVEEPSLPVVPQTIEVVSEKVVSEAKQHFSYKISDETKEILQRAIHKPQPTMEEVLREDKIKNYDPVKINVHPQNLQPAPRELPPVVPPPPPVIPAQKQEDFTTIFNQKIVQENAKTDKFAQLLSLQNIHNKFDCLIACAYHLVERENFERFTLKQINTLSKALLEEAIEHDTLKEALERRFIKIVPDYTGIATTMEYTLTDNGIRYFEQDIAE